MANFELSSGEDLREIAAEDMREGGLFVYDSGEMQQKADLLNALEMPYGMTVRYAAKANPNRDVVGVFDLAGLHFDASSVNEAAKLVRFGIAPHKISLSSQVISNEDTHAALIKRGVKPVATSMRQLNQLGESELSEVAVRINPGIGSGHNNRTNVGGPASSFGIWHEQLAEVKEQADAQGQRINRLHTHIGSGADPAVWRSVIQKSLAIVGELPDVDTLDIGGGFKVARMENEPTTDMQKVGLVFAEEIEQFKRETGRAIHLEIEPGTFLVALAGTMVGRVMELTQTPDYNFIKLNVGMNGLLRPSMYGAQHPIKTLSTAGGREKFVVVGPCCESGDILTPAPGDPEGILPRDLQTPYIGGYVALGGAGAYGPSMAARSYNDIPEPTEVVV